MPPAPDRAPHPLLRGHLAPPPRTLVDVLRATADAHPDEPALDNGTEVLTYAEFLDAAGAVAASLADACVGVGDRVGIRIPSGTTDLYVAIAGTLLAGAAYVPVDVDDPDERARVVFGEAGVDATVTADLVVRATGEATGPGTGAPGIPAPDDGTTPGPDLDDDAWIIFTSGSTGTPKGVAVTHRNAAAFVDAEARMFLQDAPLAPGDRVMAGLSVAFDASCEEMWLAWRYGACLVPAPRSLVKSGMDLGPWLLANDITVVSTVPTLVALWPAEALARVRLLILGGEACPPELGARLVTAGREVWNTYGPTEATVVACGARLTGEPPIRIGLPLDGWDLAVCDDEGRPVPDGQEGELVIGGVGLARYLDPAKDASVYAANPHLGWSRAYRSGDRVRFDGVGLVFGGRKDDQVKVGGRRIELGEIDSALLQLPGVGGAAAAVRRTEAGNSLLVGYVALDDDPAVAALWDAKAATEHLRASMPAALVPRLAVVATLPTRTSGKIDRDALPWPLPSGGSRGGGGAGGGGAGGGAELHGTAAWVADLWQAVLGGAPESGEDDFFDSGGGSLSAAQLVSRLRERFPEVTVADIYEAPTVAALAAALDDMATPTGRLNRDVVPVPVKTQAAQVVANLVVRGISGLRWLTWAGLAGLVLTPVVPGMPLAPALGWGWVALGWLLLVTPWGRIALSALAARVVLHGVGPGNYPRGGKVHLRLWLAERLADEIGGASVAGAPWITLYARLLGNRVGRDVHLHSLPPVTGLLTVGDGACIEPEVDLRGHWLDGGRLHIGAMRVRAGARVGARSTLVPGADVRGRAFAAPGSAVFGEVPAGEIWSGAPAAATGARPAPAMEVPPTTWRWRAAYVLAALTISLLPLVATLAGVLAALAVRPGRADDRGGLWPWLAWGVPLGTVVGFVVLAGLVLVVVRLLGVRLEPGHHPVHSRQAWQAWSTLRVLDEARTWLFPIYSSSLTPTWLRLLGADIGPDVEASTVLLIPGFVRVGEGAFLADDTLVGGYELHDGRLRVERVRIGKRAFVGNSGMAGPGRKVPKAGLVAVLSRAPHAGAKRGVTYVGSPPRPLRREAPPASGSASERTFAPPRRLRVARALVELARAVPVVLHVALVLATAWVLLRLLDTHPLLAVVASGPVLVAAGAFAAALAVAAKWLLVGRLRRGDHPLWSSFVWRNELADTFVEVLAAPWFARLWSGTPLLNLWLRAMGARIGRGVWCDTYWLPEADLIDLRDGATVGAGCVVQTHLFHDRVLSMDTVTLAAGATLGPNSVILPAARIGKHATVGPCSLVMRGESVPDRTRWIGNPVAPWGESGT